MIPSLCEDMRSREDRVGQAVLEVLPLTRMRSPNAKPVPLYIFFFSTSSCLAELRQWRRSTRIFQHYLARCFDDRIRWKNGCGQEGNNSSDKDKWTREPDAKSSASPNGLTPNVNQSNKKKPIGSTQILSERGPRIDH